MSLLQCSMVLGVPDEQALAMILFNNIFTVILMVGLGLLFLWRSGINIQAARLSETKLDGRA